MKISTNPPLLARRGGRGVSANHEHGMFLGWEPSPHPSPRGRGGVGSLGRLVRFGGFTLIEVLVVVVILGILAGLIVPRIMDRPDQARVVAARNDIGAINNALKLYRLDNGTYPSADQGLAALVRKPETGEIPRNWKSGGYLERLPKDPWGSDYQYLNPGIHGEVDVLSLGADRQPGGENYGTDIGSWNLDN